MKKRTYLRILALVLAAVLALAVPVAAMEEDVVIVLDPGHGGLVSATAFPAPRRTSNGIDYNRLCLILAVLEKRLGLRFSVNDVYLNVIGGMHLDEPASDVAVAMALISSLTDRAVPDDLIAIGELGLSGECRAVSGLEYRVKEAARLGFTRAVIPFRNLEKRQIKADIELIPVKSIFEVLKYLSSPEKAQI